MQVVNPKGGKLNISPYEDDETLTAYHEAGHVVVGYLLGARIDEVRLGSMIEDCLPNHFGDCLISWGRVDPKCEWQTQCEVLTMLAGPVAEMTYRGERYHPALFGPWRTDWQQAVERTSDIFLDPREQTKFLELLVMQLIQRMSDDRYWAAVAAVADELVAHESLSHEDIETTVSFWLV